MEILSCRFCNCTDNLQVQKNAYLYRVVCNACDAAGPEVKSENEAIHLWNAAHSQVLECKTDHDQQDLMRRRVLGLCVQLLWDFAQKSPKQHLNIANNFLLGVGKDLTRYGSLTDIDAFIEYRNAVADTTQLDQVRVFSLFTFMNVLRELIGLDKLSVDQYKMLFFN